MDTSVLQGRLTSISSYASLLITLEILGMRLQMSTAKTPRAHGEMMYNTTLTSPMRSYRTPNKRLTRTKRQIQAGANARRDNNGMGRKKKAVKTERLSPDEFEKFFIKKYLTKSPNSSATEKRDYDYLEPYRFGGNWILYTPIPDMGFSPWSDGAYLDWRKQTNPTYPPTAETVEGGTRPSSWSIYRHCFPICLSIYKDFGPVCATRLVEQGYYWATQYRDFVDYCALQYYNCEALEYWFKIAHRGSCPEKYKKFEMSVDNDDWVIPQWWRFDTYHLKLDYPARFPERLSNTWQLKQKNPKFVQEPNFNIDYKWANYHVGGE